MPQHQSHWLLIAPRISTTTELWSVFSRLLSFFPSSILLLPPPCCSESWPVYELIRLTFRLNYGLLGARVALNTECIFQAMNWEVVSKRLWVWQSHSAWQKCPLLFSFQQCASSSTPLFCCALQDYLSVYFSAPVCWHTTLSTPPGLSSEPGEVCINPRGSLLQSQSLKPKGDSKSSINEETGGQQQVIVFMPEN